MPLNAVFSRHHGHEQGATGLIKWLRSLFGAPQPAAEWSVAAGDEGGKPVVVRTRTRAPEGMSAEMFPATIELVWRFDGGVSGGMPPSELLPLMDQFEDLIGAFEGPACGLLGLTITGNNRRQWVWCVADSEAFTARVRTAMSTSSTSYPVEVRRDETNQ